MPVWISLGVLLGYGLFVAGRLGLHQRLALAFRPISLQTIPDRAARKYGDRILFTTDSPCEWEVPLLHERDPDPLSWSARRFTSTIGYLATMLREELGVRSGDRVAVFKQNHLDIHIFNTAIIRAGGIACPINGNFAADHVRPYLLKIGAEILVSDTTSLLRVLSEGGDLGNVRVIVLAETRSAANAASSSCVAALVARHHAAARLVWIEEVLATVDHETSAVARDRESPMYLVHSSGTTGFPKAVILRNGAQSHAVRGWLCYVHLSPSRDTSLVAVPNNHQAVILTFNGSLLLGLRVHWNSGYAREDFDAAAVIEQLATRGFTAFFGFPIAYTQLKELRLDAYDLRRMRVWASTADAMHESVQRRFVAVGGAFRNLGLPFAGSIFLDAQGSSEVGTPSVLRYVTKFTKKFARRVGRPGSTPLGPAIRIVDARGGSVPRGAAGRLEVKGKTVFNAYWNDQALTRASFHGKWFFTGDVVRRARDGHVIQLDRQVDVIHTRAGDVYSLLIEEKIHEHWAVFDACVYAARQSDGSQLPAVAVALRAGSDITVEALREQLNNALSPEERLQRVDIIPWAEFPMGVTGKTLKRVFAGRTESGAPNSPDRAAHARLGFNTNEPTSARG